MASDWHTPPFASLPDSGVPGLRWMGTTLMDEATYRDEGWHCRTLGSHLYWRATEAGLRQRGFATASERRRRKEAWKSREEGDPSRQAWIDDLVSRQP